MAKSIERFGDLVPGKLDDYPFAKFSSKKPKPKARKSVKDVEAS